MPTLTIRNVPAAVIESLETLARRNRRSMEQEVHKLLRQHVGERRSVVEQIEESWSRQSRRPTRREIETWIASGRG